MREDCSTFGDIHCTVWFDTCTLFQSYLNPFLCMLSWHSMCLVCCVIYILNFCLVYEQSMIKLCNIKWQIFFVFWTWFLILREKNTDWGPLTIEWLESWILIEMKYLNGGWNCLIYSFTSSPNNVCVAVKGGRKIIKKKYSWRRKERAFLRPRHRQDSV
jgi:hypothetical protein